MPQRLKSKRWLLPLSMAVLTVAGLAWAWLASSTHAPIHDGDPEYVPAHARETLSFLAARTTAKRFARDLKIIDPKNSLAPYITQQEHQLLWRPLHLEDAPEVFVFKAPQTFPSKTAIHTPKRPLKGLRIALDPGHFGGAWSQAEHRHLSSENKTQNVQPIKEGDLTWATAIQLQALLKQEGAQVRISRAPPPQKNIPQSKGNNQDDPSMLLHRLGRYGAWFRPNLKNQDHLQIERRIDHIQTQAQGEQYKAFNRYELRRRADEIAAFDAHLTLSLHYNIAKKPKLNGIMVFVPGNVLPGELATPPERYFALRRALEGSLGLSIQLGIRIGKAMQAHMDLPGFERLAENPNKRVKMLVHKKAGVFARNLAILKRTPGPVLLLEGPCMNNPQEELRLRRKDIFLAGRAYPRRTRQYAHAVHEAIVAEAEALQRWASRP